MDVLKRGFVLLISLQVLTGCSQAKRVDPMPAVVVTEGSPFTLTCNADFDLKMEGLRMRKILPAAAVETIVTLMPNDLMVEKPEKYHVQRIGQTGFNVTIQKAVFEDARRYRCSLIVEDGINEKNVVVVVRKPDIMIQGSTHAGKTVPIECEVQYEAPHDLDPTNEAGLVPQISAHLGQQMLPGSMDNSRKNARVLKLNRTIQEEDDQGQLECRAWTNSPQYEISAFRTLSVPFAVRNVKLAPVKDVYTVGEKVNCTAEGNPTPDIKWRPVRSTIAGNIGPQLDIVDTMGVEGEVWRCIASNKLSGSEPRQAEKLLNFTVFKPTVKPPAESKADPVVTIAVGVAVPCILIFLCIIITCVVMTKKKKKKKNSYQPKEPEISEPTTVDIENDPPPGDNNANLTTRPALKPKPTVVRKPKPNVNGHNVSFEVIDKDGDENQCGQPLLKDGEANTAAIVKEDSEREGYSDSKQEMAAPADETDLSGYNQPHQRAPIVATEFPDVVAAHPGLQQAFYSSKPKPKPLPRRAQPPPPPTSPPPDTTV